jgi:hypothetical protein
MKKLQLILAALLLVTVVSITGCRKKADIPLDAATYDPGLTDPSLKVTGTILKLKQMQGANLNYTITDDIVIAGIVTADDRGGNFYKQIMIQDSTAGIALLIERSGLYNDFPVGRKIYVRCKGLVMSAYGGFKQLGYSFDETKNIVGIPSSLITSVIAKANYPNPLPIKHVTLFDLKSTANINSDAMMGSLVVLDSNMQFVESQAGPTYAQAPTFSSGTDRFLEQCFNASTIVLRTSGYCKFAGEPWPKGRGSMAAIYSRYNNTAQLLIRDLNDVRFTDSVRCGGVVIQPATPMSIKDLRKLYVGSTLTNGVKLGKFEIHGTIISSYVDSNQSKTPGSFYMQDESGYGINVFSSGSNFALGDSVTIDMSDDSLIVYAGNLEIKKGASSSLLITQVGSGKTVTPRVVTAKQLADDLAIPNFSDRLYECTLVEIPGASLTSSTGFYAGSNLLTDLSGTITMYCRNAQPYNNTPIFTGSKSVTGIGANFNTTNQILIRRLSDIK